MFDCLCEEPVAHYLPHFCIDRICYVYNLNRKWIIYFVLSCKGASSQRHLNVIRKEYSILLSLVLHLLR